MQSQIDAGNEVAGFGFRGWSEPDSATWRKVVLRAVNAADADVEIELLRPGVWLEKRRATVGSVIEIDLPELHVRGSARVRRIDSALALEGGPGTVVTGRFRHLARADNLLDVYVVGENEPIGCTAGHPFWSQTRRRFIPARDLAVGERLLTKKLFVPSCEIPLALPNALLLRGVNMSPTVQLGDVI